MGRNVRHQRTGAGCKQCARRWERLLHQAPLPGSFGQLPRPLLSPPSHPCSQGASPAQPVPWEHVGDESPAAVAAREAHEHVVVPGFQRPPLALAAAAGHAGAVAALVRHGAPLDLETLLHAGERGGRGVFEAAGGRGHCASARPEPAGRHAKAACSRTGPGPSLDLPSLLTLCRPSTSPPTQCGRSTRTAWRRCCAACRAHSCRPASPAAMPNRASTVSGGGEHGGLEPLAPPAHGRSVRCTPAQR